MTAQPQSDRSLGDLIADLTSDVSTLMRQELALAKAELRQSASEAGKGAGMLGGAGLAGWFALLFLSTAAWWALGNAIGRGWAALVVAVVWAIVAAILASVGKARLKQVRGVPETADTVKKIPNALRGNEEDNR